MKGLVDRCSAILNARRREESRPAAAGPRTSPLLIVLVGIGLALLSSGCAGGKYLLDVFPEMHYQPSYRAQEPPSLAPPDGAVPVSGGEAELTATQASQMSNPLARQAGAAERGAALFKVNCVPCHGASGKGDGLVGQQFQRANGPRPADLTSTAIQSRGDGSLFYSITYGLRDPKTLVGMPAFRSLLTPDQRWSLVSYIRALGGR